MAPRFLVGRPATSVEARAAEPPVPPLRGGKPISAMPAPRCAMVSVGRWALLVVAVNGCVSDQREPSGDRDEDRHLDDGQVSIGSQASLDVFVSRSHEDSYESVFIVGDFLVDFEAFNDVEFETGSFDVQDVSATSTSGLNGLRTTRLSLSDDGFTDIVGLDAVREIEISAFPSIEVIDLPGLVEFKNANQFLPQGSLCTVNIPSAAPSAYCDLIVAGELFTCGTAAEPREATVVTACPRAGD